ncbi:hypothetical protein AAEX28_10690 [Lentisphaerota bacterium WC36G]|nr:hypothetical protein LJT99_13535 [Lentisphaerae bacterium WC36]
MKNSKILVVFTLTILIGLVVSLTLIFMPKRQEITPQNIPITSEQAEIKEIKEIQKTTINNANKISNAIIVVVIFVQLLTLIGGASVFANIKNSSDSAQLKLKRIDSADIFLDLPLYIGLFGTVVSFLIISYNPQASRLVAYSSTLIGIIISTLMKVFIHYPLKQKLLTVIEEESIKLKKRD